MDQATAVQIITPVAHKFQLQLDQVKRLFEAEHIKDRHVSIVSIAGALRKGKSFLLNFYLKYFYAQVMKLMNSLIKGTKLNLQTIFSFFCTFSV